MHFIYDYTVSFIGTLIAAIDDATYPQTVVKSENEFLKEIVAMIDKDGGDELVKMNVFDILWNLCHQYVNYELYYGDDDDDDDDDDEDEEDEDDDLKDKEKEKAEKKKKKEEEVVLCKKYYDWMGKYHDKCIKFVSSLLTEKHFKDIQDEVNKLFTTISDDMSGKLEAKKDKNKDENKEGDKINKKKKKKTKNAAVTTELMKKWSVIHTNLSDKIQTIQLSFNLLKGIFESNDEMISKPKDNEDKNEDKEEKENEEMDDEQLKKMKKTIISSKCRNEMVGMINDHWINNNFDTKKLLEISENVGIEIGDEIDAKLKEVKLDSINLIYEFMSESIISLSNSQWQSLWNFGCKLFHDDNEQSKKDIPLRQKHNEKLMANSQKDDGGKEENKNEMDQDDMDDIDALDDHFSNRDDMQIGYLLLEAIKKCKDLKITASQIDDLMNIHKRIRNCQSMATKHSIEYLENPQVFLPIDLIYVDDMNQFGVYINDTLKELFKNEIVKKDKDRQRSILNGLYEDCQVLAENRKFISGLIKYYKEVKDKKKEYKAEDGSSLLESHLIEWNGGDASQVGFDTCQIILDIMSDDQYAKLTMNKRNFESILKNYKQYQEEWKKLKVIVDEYNKTVDAENNKKDNKNKDEDNDEYEFEDGGYNKIIWEEIDCISKPADECITNINKFLKEVN